MNMQTCRLARHTVRRVRALLQGTCIVLATTCYSAMAAEDPAAAEDLAKQLSNPIASLISVPIQFNYDQNIGPADDGERLTINIQPVIPFSLNQDWNLISRTIVPIVNQNNIFPASGDQFGIGDIVQSVFFSPTLPTSSGIIWGAGPVFLLPTATDKLLGASKWGLGPTAVALRQQGPWTTGGLINHIWSFAGDENRPGVSSTLIQPFVSYTTSESWTFSLNLESAYNWKAEEWSVPINAQISKLLVLGSRPVSVYAGVRYWAESSTTGPEGLGFRFGLTLLYPR